MSKNLLISRMGKLKFHINCLDKGGHYTQQSDINKVLCL
jgi:hypothetical protein